MKLTGCFRPEADIRNPATRRGNVKGICPSGEPPAFGHTRATKCGRLSSNLSLREDNKRFFDRHLAYGPPSGLGRVRHMAQRNLRSRISCIAQRHTRPVTLTVLLLLFATSNAVGQGPSPAYFHDLGSQIPWAECVAYQPGGSSQKIPFIPAIVTTPVRAPAGTQGYSRDVQFDSDIVFLGEGLEESADGTGAALSIDGAVALTLESTSPATFEERVMALARRGAVAVAVFPKERQVFYPVLKPERIEDFEDLVPVIAWSHDTARRLFAAHSPLGEQALQRWIEGGEAPRLERMVPRVRCFFEGRFRRLESPGFVFLSRQSSIDEVEAAELLRVNERSVAFLLELFDGAGVAWTKTPTVYFRGHDAKVFYTLHWGTALANATGSYLLYSGEPDFGLVVHENTHSLFDRSWGETTSFLTEGLAMYAQAQAVDPMLCHRRTNELRQRGASVPLEQLLDHEIGTPGKATDFGYPAAGSFVEFLLQQEGYSKFEVLYKQVQSSPNMDVRDLLAELYGATPSELEAAWISWLGDFDASGLGSTTR
jgi:hypothetical protein